jgi:predicted O-linked N-acetylglucosamine transferase (SPINDLY family)
MLIIHWENFDNQKNLMLGKIDTNEKVVLPFPLLSIADTPSKHRVCAETYIQDKFPQNNKLGIIPKRIKQNRIRLGYYSADFYIHPVAFLIAELIETHNKEKFETIAFSFGPDIKDQMRNRLSNAFDKFIDVRNKTDNEIALLSRRLEIDIAIDLVGYTSKNRTGIFSYRVAPIQINYLGYPGTMGANYIDYIIADKTLIPAKSNKFYSEKIIYLPNSYQANDRTRLISDKQFTKAALGLPENGFVFACFNNNYKILPSTFDLWCKILVKVEGSVLWLLDDNPIAKKNLIKEAVARGIDSTRVVFAERIELSEHLARHRQADLFLDTFPYNAHTTASDALWAGLPVLTLMGESFASRVAASLLTAIDLPELITSSQEHYEALAIELATNPAKLKEIKTKLESNRLTTPLFDTPRFTKHLEDAYTKMCKRYHADLPPEHIYIEQELSQIHLRNYSL